MLLKPFVTPPPPTLSTKSYHTFSVITKYMYLYDFNYTTWMMVTNRVILYNTFSFDCKPTNLFITTYSESKPVFLLILALKNLKVKWVAAKQFILVNREIKSSWIKSCLQYVYNILFTDVHKARGLRLKIIWNNKKLIISHMITV